MGDSPSSARDYDLDRLLAPRGIAIVGASPEAKRIGGQPLRALLDFGYEGAIYPVNPKYQEIAGLRCYPNAADVPAPCDVALVAAPARAVPNTLRDCARAGIPFAIILSAGFREAGPQGAALQQELDRALTETAVRVIGPNCQGILSPLLKVYCGFGAPFQYPHKRSGPVALVTQSGGFGFAVMGQSESAGIAFNFVVSTGNEADLGALDIIANLLERSDTQIVATYLEGVADGRRLIELGQRAAELDKPILVWKVGNSAIGREAAASHTANLTGPYDLYRQAFREGAFLEVQDIDDLVDLARAFESGKRPEGNRIAVVSVSGGAGVLLADCCEEFSLRLAPLRPETLEIVRNALPGFSSARNPIDVTAQIFNDETLFEKVLTAVLQDDTVDQVIVVTASLEGALAERIAKQICSLAIGPKSILVAASAPSERAAAALALLAESHVPFYPTPRRAAKAAAALHRFVTLRAKVLARRSEVRFQPKAPLDLAGAGTLGEHRSKAIISAYGVPTVKEHLISLVDLERLSEAPISFPLVAKLESPDLPHKSEAGAVALNIACIEELKRAARSMMASAREYRPDARIDGILVQEQASGFEAIMGAVVDPFFGPIVMAGLGGIHAELLQDVVHRFAPFDPQVGREMIADLRGSALMHGFRNQKRFDVEALADALSRLSWLIADHADRIVEIDVNPIFVRPEGEGVVAADALVRMRSA